MSLTIPDLFTTTAPADFYAKFLSVATILGLAPSTWPEKGAMKTYLRAVADFAGYGSLVIGTGATGNTSLDLAATYLARSGFLDSAADGGDGFLDVLADNLHGETRAPASKAAGPVVLTNAGGATRGPFAVGAYHLVNASLKKTYSNSEVFSLLPGSDTTVQFQADEAGSASTTVANVLTPVTSFVGVSVKTSGGANTNSLVGSDAQTNASLVSTCRTGLQALNPQLSPSGAFLYFALTSTFSGYPTLAGGPVTRAAILTDPFTGIVGVYLANAAGIPSGPDIALMGTYLASVALARGTSFVALGATSVGIDVHLDVYVPAAKAGTAVADVRAAIDAHLLTLPLGGVLRLSALEAAIFERVTYVEDINNLTVDGSASDKTLLPSDLVLQSPSATVTVHST